METIPIPGVEIYYDKNSLPAEEGTVLFNILLTKCTPQRYRSSFKYAVLRDEAYYGDPGTNKSRALAGLVPQLCYDAVQGLLGRDSKVDPATPIVQQAKECPEHEGR